MINHNGTLEQAVLHHKTYDWETRNNQRHFWYDSQGGKSPALVMGKSYCQGNVEDMYKVKLLQLGMSLDDMALQHLNHYRVENALDGLGKHKTKRAYHQHSMRLLEAMGIAKPKKHVGKKATPQQMQPYIGLARWLVEEARVD